MKIGDVNGDRIFAVQGSARQGINRSSYMSYLASGYTLYEMIIGDTVDGGIGAVLGAKIIGPDDLGAVMDGTASIVYAADDTEGTEGTTDDTEGTEGTADDTEGTEGTTE